ncbi:MAG TPA: hypothetical protein VGE47_08390 [Burkholderiaceae bacterium]
MNEKRSSVLAPPQLTILLMNLSLLGVIAGASYLYGLYSDHWSFWPVAMGGLWSIYVQIAVSQPTSARALYLRRRRRSNFAWGIFGASVMSALIGWPIYVLFAR